MRRQFLTSTTALVLLLGAGQAYAGMDEAKAFLDAEIKDMSTLDRAAQEAEMQWFIDAAKPFAGMDIKVVSETITTHEYESKVLAKAFTDITGIKVTHDIIGEGDVVEKLQTQMQSGENVYDAYVNDSDLIGTHWRYQQARNLTDWMAGEGKAVTNPNLDLNLKGVVGHSLWVEQLKAMGLTVVMSVLGTVVLAYAIKAVMGLRPSLEDEETGLDLSDHGEKGYHLGET